MVHHAGLVRIGGLHTPLRTLWRTLRHAGFRKIFFFKLEVRPKSFERTFVKKESDAQDLRRFFFPWACLRTWSAGTFRSAHGLVRLPAGSLQPAELTPED
ncbi:jg3285 [Pararge aegeria aegeria]|uniref:Jg3285 protein n=1 Tax=Pararge aegeria aegeria TaxID=348720 RepID=A0A8S4RTQ8_9NEOP|nr:jg3285 [Pararge aegeria aegeria]